MAIEKNQVYKCGVCGNIVEVVEVGGGELACCGQPMTQLAENSTDAATEKPQPVGAMVASGYNIEI